MTFAIGYRAGVVLRERALKEDRVSIEENRLVGAAIDSKVRIASVEKTAERIENSVDKLVFDISLLRTDLPWRMITAAAVGGSIPGLIVIGALLIRYFLGSS